MLTVIIPVYKLSDSRKRNLEFIYARIKDQLEDIRVIIALQSYEDDCYYDRFDEVVYFRSRLNHFNKSALINHVLNKVEIKTDFVMFLDCDIYFNFKNLKNHLTELSDEEIIKPFIECIYLTEILTLDFIYKKKALLPSSLKKIIAPLNGALIISNKLLKNIRFKESFSNNWSGLGLKTNKHSIKTIKDFSVHLFHTTDHSETSDKKSKKSKIVHVFNYACVPNEHRLYKHQEKAVDSFVSAKKNLDVLLLNACSKNCLESIEVLSSQIKRSAKDIGYNRDLPFLNDVVESGLPYVEDEGWIVYTNSDCCIGNDFYQHVLNCDYDYIEFKRQDTDEEGTYLASVERGTDGFAIKKKLLESKPIPNLLIGAPYWDDVMSNTYLYENSMVMYNVLFHVQHKFTYDLNSLDIAGEFNYNKLINLIDLTPNKRKISLESFNFSANKLECVCILLTKNEVDNKSYEEFISRLKQTTTVKEASGIDFIIITNKHINKSQLKLDVLKNIFKNVEVINLKLSPEEDLYIKEIPPGPLYVPKHGIKSGPNLMFFKSIRKCKKYNTILLMETDCFVKKRWLNKIKNFVTHSNGFWISGATYDGTVHCKAGSYMMTHINGGTGLYATGNKNFQIFINNAEEFIIDKIKNGIPYLAYDCGIKMFIDQNVDNAKKADDILLWKLINRQYLPNKLIGNFSVDEDKCLKIEDIERMYNYYIVHKK